MSHIVLDDFCDRIEDVKASAHAAGFGTWAPNKAEVGSGYYEGMCYPGLHALLLKPLTMAVGGVVIPNSMFFRATNVGMEKAYIHSDREMGNYTCVTYLTQHDEPYGTAFYRHKPTGLTSMPSYKEMLDAGIFEELARDMTSRDPEKWELLDVVEGKYNRAVIFDAPLFHSRFPIEGLGSSAADARIIWACHFYRMNGHAELF